VKAMVLRAPSELVLDEVARPQPGPGQVLVRVTHSGVCGTDYKIYNGSIKVSYPLIPGHEMAGEIVDIDSYVDRVQPSTGSTRGGPGDLRTGDRVIIDPDTYERTCVHWQKGLTNLCRNGTRHRRDVNGGFAQYLLVPESQI